MFQDEFASAAEEQTQSSARAQKYSPVYACYPDRDRPGGALRERSKTTAQQNRSRDI
jgi:hypothetical protein